MIRISIAASALIASALPSQQFADARLEHLPEPISGSVAHFDWSGDGVADLVYVDASFALRFAVNDTNGAFASAPITLPGSAPNQQRVVGVGDVDNDGQAEVYEALGNQLFRTGFNPAVLPLTVALDFECFALEVVDLDNDTFDEVVAFSLGAVNIYWGGPAGIGAPTRFALQVWRGYGVGDLDSDGDVDLVMPDGGPGVQWLMNGGGRTFTQQALPLPPLGDYFGAVIADLDGDSTQDLILGAGILHPFLTDGAVFLGAGGGAFSHHQNLNLVHGNGPVVGDLDGDGDLDLVAQGDGHELRVLHNDGLANFSVFDSQYVPGFRAPEALVDLDLDGDLDLIGRDWSLPGPVLALGQSTVRLAMNDGVGHLHSYQSEPVPTVDRIHFVGDMNGDQLPDIVTDFDIWLGDGHGRIGGRLPMAGLVSGNAFATILVCDIDLDGDHDVVIGNFMTQIWENDGLGNFTPTIQFSGGTLGANRPVAAADVDGDNDVDLFLVAGYPASAARLMLRQGNTYTQSSTGLGASDRLFLPVDLDNDGDLDVVTESAVLINNGVGVFTNGTAAWLPQGLPGPSVFFGNAIAADLNGDGRMDLRYRDRLLENQPSGFVDRTAAWLPVGACLPSVFVDADNDGDVDGCGYCGNQLHYLRNSGNGTFVSTPGLPLSDVGYSMWPAEVDGDDDTDLYLFGSTGMRLLVNRHRQVSVQQSPQAGQVWEIDVSGRPGYSAGDLAIVGVSLALLPAPTVLPQGTLWIDPVSTVVVAFAPMPTGALQVALPLPPTPAFNGLPMFVQAMLVPTDDHFTNLVRERIRF